MQACHPDLDEPRIPPRAGPRAIITSEDRQQIQSAVNTSRLLDFLVTDACDPSR
jgi:hypothetical protein